MRRPIEVEQITFLHIGLQQVSRCHGLSLLSQALVPASVEAARGNVLTRNGLEAKVRGKLIIGGPRYAKFALIIQLNLAITRM